MSLKAQFGSPRSWTSSQSRTQAPQPAGSRAGQRGNVTIALLQTLPGSADPPPLLFSSGRGAYQTNALCGLLSVSSKTPFLPTLIQHNEQHPRMLVHATSTSAQRHFPVRSGAVATNVISGMGHTGRVVLATHRPVTHSTQVRPCNPLAADSRPGQ